MYEKKCHKTGLWLVPLKQHEKLKTDKSQQTKITGEQQMNNIHHTNTQSELVTYLHQCLFSPTKSKLIKAIKNNRLLRFPGLTENGVNKHLPISTATIKGHLHRERKNTRPTPKNSETMNLETFTRRNMSLPQEINAACEIF